jgi:Zn ribbon nucleic-acid-binding protein
MSFVACPRCGETEQLRGERDGDVIRLTCAACGFGWMRDTTKRCRLCGSDNLTYTPKPLWEKGRGDQRTPAGRIDAWYCYDCGARDATSDEPIPEQD